MAGERRRRFRRYFLCLLVVPVMAWWPAFVLAKWPRMWRMDPSAFGAMMDYSANAQGRDADVVIFGDSAALFDISPKQLEAGLGVSVVNLPNMVGSLRVTGEWNLEHYLASNRPPRLIVFYFTAWDLDFSHKGGPGMLFEGEELMLRHGTWAESLEFGQRHPEEILMFPLHYYKLIARGFPFTGEGRRGFDRELTTKNGHLDDSPDGRPLERGCDIPGYLYREGGMSTVRELVERYQTPRTRVLVYVAPLPPCDGTAKLLARNYAQVGAAPPRVLGLGDFEDDEAYAHLFPKSVPEATRELEAAVREKLR